MKLILYTSLLFLLCACELQDDDDDNHGYGYGYDIELSSGMRIQYHGKAHRIKNDKLDQAWHETLECTDLTARAPLVAFVDYELNDSDDLIQGRLYMDTGLIVVMSLEHLSEDWTLLVLQHEIVHYLLWINGFDDTANMNHDSELFSECSY